MAIIPPPKSQAETLIDTGRYRLEWFTAVLTNDEMGFSWTGGEVFHGLIGRNVIGLRVSEGSNRIITTYMLHTLEQQLKAKENPSGLLNDILNRLPHLPDMEAHLR